MYHFTTIINIAHSSFSFQYVQTNVHNSRLLYVVSIIYRYGYYFHIFFLENVRCEQRPFLYFTIFQNAYFTAGYMVDTQWWQPGWLSFARKKELEYNAISPPASWIKWICGHLVLPMCPSPAQITGIS